MKSTFLLCFLLVQNFLLAQTNNQIIYSEVVLVENQSAQQLYNNAKIWFTEISKDPKEDIKLDDSVNFSFVAKGTMPYKTNIIVGKLARQGAITFDIKIMTKEGRYKYEFSNFYHHAMDSWGLITKDEVLPKVGGKSKWRKNVTKEMQTQVDENVKKLILSLKSRMNSKSIDGNNW